MRSREERPFSAVDSARVQAEITTSKASKITASQAKTKESKITENCARIRSLLFLSLPSVVT
ncbi:MAG: hypothetical protein Unbinned4944contig1000_30 [Prokaryotic dsDNA virus sp.]|nr:MAG: hypothetical protein Unbinned4944contig1000_30 [Prokaryotic dsDNA virus sp.]